MNYNMTMTGTLDGIAKMLVDLVEERVTGLNLNYKMDIDEMNWETALNGDSTVTGKFRFDRELERKDLRVFQDTYNVVLNLGASS